MQKELQKERLRLEHLGKCYGEAVIVKDVDLGVYEGECVALIGHSGCGKSTVLSMIAGLTPVTSGRILVDGREIHGPGPDRGMVFQAPCLLPWMNVLDNVLLGLDVAAPADAPAVRRQRAERALAAVGLGDALRARPASLSQGMRQRVALARALAKQPKVLLLDEPLAALDRKLRQETQFELMEIQVRLGTTFLVVTHDQEEAMTMADRIAVMDRGRLIEVAPPGELYERPRTRFVAEFVGDINIVEGQVAAGEDGGWQIKTRLAGEALLVHDPGAALAAGQAVAVAVRPEKMRLSRQKPPPGTPNVLQGAVWDIGYLGDWTVYRVRLDDGSILRVSRANASRAVEPPIDWEQRVHLFFAPDAAIVLTG